MKIQTVAWWMVGFCLVFLLAGRPGRAVGGDRCATVLADCVALSNQAYQAETVGDLPQARGLINRSLEGLSQHPTTKHQQQILAQSLDIFGTIALQQGQYAGALTAWQRAAAIYGQFPDLAPRLPQNLINQSLAQQKLGLSLDGCGTLLAGLGVGLACEPEVWGEGDWRRVEGAMGEAGNFGTVVALADLWRQGGYFEAARRLLVGLGVQDEPQREGLRLLRLGDTARSQADQLRTQDRDEIQFHYQACPVSKPGKAADFDGEALGYYEEVGALPLEDVGLRLPSVIEQIGLQARLGEQGAAAALVAQIPPPVAADPRLAQSRLQGSLLHYAQILQCLGEGAMARAWGEAIAATAEAQDNREMAAYGYGYGGEFFEAAGELRTAEAKTARAIAFSGGQAHLAYPWRWQMGRILAKGGDRLGSLSQYQQAYQLLQSLRNDLVAFNPGMQYDFRDRVEPFYREYVDLLLQPDITGGEISQEHLRRARDVIESLQLAALDDFFADDCTQFADTAVETADPRAAFLFMIALADRLEVIAAFPGAPLREHRVFENVPYVVETFSKNVKTGGSFTEGPMRQDGANLYRWLIKPFEADLQAYKIKTLVFAFDTVLQGLPVGALYDQDHDEYMIQKGFGLAIVPGSKLFSPRPIDQVRLRILGGARQDFKEFEGFSNLDYVIPEVQGIKAILPTEELFDEQFTRGELRAKVQSGRFPIVHIATHGKFSSRQEDTFLLIGDGKLDMAEFAAGLDLRDVDGGRVLELLVLSACETAEGDKRAALGMAGVALRSGARSTIATLWPVMDNSTAELMKAFYAILRERPELGRAEALRQAQVMLLAEGKFKDPRFWAPFVLIGNWL